MLRDTYREEDEEDFALPPLCIVIRNHPSETSETRRVLEVPSSSSMQWTDVVESPQSPPPSDQRQQQQQPIPVIPLTNNDNTTTAIKQPIVLVLTTSEQNFGIMNMDMDTCIVELIISECERTGCSVDEVVHAIQAHCLERCISVVWRAGITWTTRRCMEPDSGY